MTPIEDTGLLPVTQAVHNAPDWRDDKAFREAWRELETDGFLYSASNVEKVHIGWVMACAALQSLEQPKPSGESEVERVARAIHEYLCRRDIMTYLDNDEDCEGIARAAIAALSERGAVGEEVERYRHKKRGTVYEIIGAAELQMSCDMLVDGSSMVVYRGEDGRLWVREESEFYDGRFECIRSGAGANSSGLADTPAEKG